MVRRSTNGTNVSNKCLRPFVGRDLINIIDNAYFEKKKKEEVHKAKEK